MNDIRLQIRYLSFDTVIVNLVRSFGFFTSKVEKLSVLVEYYGDFDAWGSIEFDIT